MRPRFQAREVKTHFIQYTEDPKTPNAYVVECTCTWVARHRRLKVIEAKMDAHLSKVGGGIKPL